MRIAVIRGCNLASLVGPFEIHLDKPPLCDAGLFTITGPTGAGKSSILDAMCLALFGNAPRLRDQGRGVKVGRAEEEESLRLPLGDPRSLVTRGAAFGYAEVEYVGRDGRRYRARWEARRARSLSTGRFQDPEMQLEDMERHQLLGGTRTEILQQVVRTLGLKEDQFRRSALLAQGDFATFLEAKGDRRADLLEQMTGTELYSAISIAAHARAKDAELALAQYEADLSAMAVLSEEARAERVDQVDKYSKARAEERRHVEAAQAALRWYERLTDLNALELQAREAVRLAEEANVLATAERQGLERLDRALPLREIVLAVDTAVTARERAGVALSRAEEARAVALHEQTAAHDAACLAEAELAHATRAFADAQPDLEQATQWDGGLQQNASHLADAETALVRARQSQEQVARELGLLDPPLASAKTEATRAERWLHEHAALEPLVSGWTHWRTELARFEQAFRRAQDLGSQIGALETRRDAHRERAVGALRAAQQADQQSAESRAAWEAADRAAHAATLSDLERAERDQLGARLSLFEEMKGWVAEAGRLAADQKADTERAESDRVAAEQSRAKAKDIEAELANGRAALAESQIALDQVRAALGFAEHRAALRAGDPCPLCGSSEHPYAVEEGLVASLFEKHRDRVRHLEHEVQTVGARLTQLRLVSDQLDRNVKEARARSEQAGVKLVAVVGKWEAALERAGIDAPSPDEAGGRAVARSSALVVERLDALRARENRAVQLATEARRCYRQWSEAEAARVRVGTALEQANAARSQAEQELERAVRDCGQARTEADQAADALTPLFAHRTGWRTGLEQDPGRFARSCAAEVAELTDWRSRLESSRRILSQLEEQRGRWLTALGERENTVRSCQEQRARIEQERAELTTRRGQLLGGKPVAVVRRELDGAVQLAQAALGRAQNAERLSAATAVHTSSQHASAQMALDESTITLERTRARLDDALRVAGFDEAGLRADLAVDAEQIAHKRRAMVELDHRLKSAYAVWGDRRQARWAHEQSQPPALTDELARVELDRARKAEEDATTAAAALEAELDQDGRLRTMRDKYSQELEAKKVASRRWIALDELLGAADGKKFRSFAQSLTLDALVAYANLHLRDLAPRYQLMRVPGHDMELEVVDRDMAEEVRGTNTLSGGETFLVSLALALGLSSLAARDVRIETLFVDEGFGSLDPGTLDAALSALETLPHAGRQVGIISHVGALTDRVGAEVRVQRLGAGRSRVLLGGKPTVATSSERPFALEPKAPKRVRKRKGRAEPVSSEG